MWMVLKGLPEVCSIARKPTFAPDVLGRPVQRTHVGYSASGCEFACPRSCDDGAGSLTTPLRDEQRHRAPAYRPAIELSDQRDVPDGSRNRARQIKIAPIQELPRSGLVQRPLSCGIDQGRGPILSEPEEPKDQLPASIASAEVSADQRAPNVVPALIADLDDEAAWRYVELLHGQYPQSQHSARLCAGLRPVSSLGAARIAA